MICFSEKDLQQHEERIINHALAEKDMEWKRRVGLDCGGHSCFYAVEKTGMRHNGRCSCDPKRTKQDYDVLWAKYQQLMEKAVRFAVLAGVRSACKDAGDFLQSPEVQAWKKERKI